jgi:hypothetical protein
MRPPVTRHLERWREEPDFTGVIVQRAEPVEKG